MIKCNFSIQNSKKWKVFLKEIKLIKETKRNICYHFIVIIAFPTIMRPITWEKINTFEIIRKKYAFHVF